MRRTAAATAASLLAALAIGGPLASTGGAAPARVQCATAAPSAACGLLDDLAAQLGPISPLLGPALAPLTGSALGLGAQSDQPGGVPTAQVVSVSRDLLAQLGTLPEPVEALVGAAGLDGLGDTLRALVAELTAPVAGEPQSSAGGSAATPAARSGSSGPVAASGSRSGAASSSTGSASAGSAPSSAAVPDVPVGDPLTLGPLAVPEFTFDGSFEPVVAAMPSADAAQEAAFAEVVDDLGGESRTTELAVVAVLSLLLLSGAGVAQLQASRHQIPG